MKSLEKALAAAQEKKDCPEETLNDLMSEVKKFIENPPQAVTLWASKIGVPIRTAQQRAKTNKIGYMIGKTRVIDWLEAEEIKNAGRGIHNNI